MFGACLLRHDGPFLVDLQVEFFPLEMLDFLDGNNEKEA